MGPTKGFVELRDAVYGRVDLTDLQHVLHSECMQRMSQIKQLGGVYLVFSSATHTRLSHMIGVAHVTKIRTRELVRQGIITKDEALNVEIAGLVHDVGHGVFSHLIEAIRGNHDDAGTRAVETVLAEPIQACGGNPAAIASIMRRDTSLADIVFATPLGADKLDYLVRDAFMANGDRLSLDDFFTTHVRWDHENGLYLLPRGLPLALATINRYWYQYSEIYERISTRLAERYLQELLRQMIALDNVVLKQLEDGGEDGVMGAIRYWTESNQEHECTERLHRLAARVYPKKNLIFTPHPDITPAREKATQKKIECSPSLLNRSTEWTVEDLARIEQEIAAVLGISPAHVSVAQAPNARRWRVPKVKIQSGGGVRFLEDLMPELEVMGRSYEHMSRNIVVSVIHEHRERVVQSRMLQSEIHSVLSRAA